ncbi:MAG: STAS domain-containing protein [Ilumatobacteraceae bacterium]
MQLTCRLASFADLAVLECTGEVDLATLPRFRDALVRHVDLHPGQVVAVDVDGLAALDDAGLGILLGAGARARSRHGDVLVICGSPRLRFRLGASRLDQALDVHPTAVAAAAAAATPAVDETAGVSSPTA